MDGTVIDLELGRLRFGPDETLGDVLGRSGLERLGKRAWRKHVKETAHTLMKAFLVDSVVLGGGNAKKVSEDLPAGVPFGHNLTAFLGGFRLWNGGVEDDAKGRKAQRSAKAS